MKCNERQIQSMNVVIFEHEALFQRYLEAFVQQYLHEATALSTGRIDEIERYIAENYAPTLFFLDIVFESERDQTQGFTVARRIKEQRPDDLIVFVTAYRNRIEGNTFYQVSAFNTIYKPHNPTDFDKISNQLAATVELAKDYFDKECLVITGRENELFIPLRSICYIEVLKGEQRICIHTTQGWYTVRGWLKDIKSKLDGRFAYASRFIIVNKNAIREKDKRGKRLIFKDGSSCAYSPFYNKWYGMD